MKRMRGRAGIAALSLSPPSLDVFCCIAPVVRRFLAGYNRVQYSSRTDRDAIRELWNLDPTPVFFFLFFFYLAMTTGSVKIDGESDDVVDQKGEINQPRPILPCMNEKEPRTLSPLLAWPRSP